MESKKISYKYYKIAMLIVWTLAILCIVATWVGFGVANNASIAFAAIVDSFLTLAIVFLAVLLILNERKDYKTRGWMFVGFGAAHLILFVICMALKDSFVYGSAAVYAIPAIHTVLLVALSAVGIYFWIRNKFTFKSFAQQDAVAAFGADVEQAKEESEEPKPSKPPRDEKTGIVSL